MQNNLKKRKRTESNRMKMNRNGKLSLSLGSCQSDANAFINIHTHIRIFIKFAHLQKQCDTIALFMLLVRMLVHSIMLLLVMLLLFFFHFGYEQHSLFSRCPESLACMHFIWNWKCFAMLLVGSRKPMITKPKVTQEHRKKWDLNGKLLAAIVLCVITNVVHHECT